MTRKNEVVFSAKLEYEHNLRVKGNTLDPHSDNLNVDVKDLERDVKRVIAEELPFDMKEIFGIEVKTRIISTRYGSLTVFFGAVVIGLRTIAGYKDFYDSMQLLRNQCDALLKRLLGQRYSRAIEVSVQVEHPRLPDPDDIIRFPRRFRKAFGPIGEEWADFFTFSGFSGFNRGQRDGFFWYLLLMNFSLFVLLGILVGRAVLKVYFP